MIEPLLLELLVGDNVVSDVMGADGFQKGREGDAAKSSAAGGPEHVVDARQGGVLAGHEVGVLSGGGRYSCEESAASAPESFFRRSSGESSSLSSGTLPSRFNP